MVAKYLRPKKSPTVAHPTGNEASTTVNKIVKSQSGHIASPQMSGGTAIAGTSMHAAISPGLFTLSAIHPTKKCERKFKKAKTPSKKAACSWLKPFQTMRGTKCTLTVL